MKALIDTDILRYEIGFGSETMARGYDLAIPPWNMVENLLEARIDEILRKTEADSYTLYITEGDTFRYGLAKTKPYKGNRQANKPWHFANLTSHLKHIMGARVVSGIEADDQLAIDHLTGDGQTVLCSRDKDLRQVPGLFFSWELGKQPQFGPVEIDELGSLIYENGKLSGTGYLFFCAQLLMGDTTDNIPGLPGCGPKKAFDALIECVTENDAIWTVEQMYMAAGLDDDYLLEQGRLCWITRSLNEDGSPVLWRQDKE